MDRVSSVKSKELVTSRAHRSGGLPVNLDLDGIKSVIPHREPFLWIDSIENLEPGKRTVAYKTLDVNEDFFRGHFPGAPVMPGVLIVEAMAQAGAVVILSLPQYKGCVAFFAGIDDFRFRDKVLPGDTLRFEVKITKLSRRAGRGAGEVFVGDRLVCNGELFFVIDIPREETNV